MGGLDAAGMEYVIALEKPNFLLVPLLIELHFAEVAFIVLVDDTFLEVGAQYFRVVLDVSHLQFEDFK